MFGVRHFNCYIKGEHKKGNIMKRQLKYGIFIFLSLVGYYFIMKAFGLHDNMWLRGLNFGIVFFWLYQMNHSKKESTKYLEQFANNLIAAATGVLMFSLSIFIYLTWLNPEFMNVMEQSWMFSNILTPALISVAVFIEGIASSVVLSLIVMQIFKNKWSAYKTVKSHDR